MPRSSLDSPKTAGCTESSERVDASATAALPFVEIYTDGGCQPNPGPGGYGVVLLHLGQRAEASGGYRSTTNNRMEMLAAITGLEKLKGRCRVRLYSDSQYLVNAIMKRWAVRWKKNGWHLSNKEPAKNVDLWERLLQLCAEHQVEFCWVKGHAGNRENERCDRLCTAALGQANTGIDEPYEASLRQLSKQASFRIIEST